MVFEDADLESAVNGQMVSGIFGASGQSCVAGSRLYLQDSIADGFLDDLVARAGQIRIGDPLAEEDPDGPARHRGADDPHRGRGRQGHRSRRQAAPRRQEAGAPRRRLVSTSPPSSNARPRRPAIVDTELFGPVLSVLRFKTEEEVVAARQRHQVRPRLRHLHPRRRARAARRQGDPRRHRLGQHLPGGLAQSPSSAASRIPATAGKAAPRRSTTTPGPRPCGSTPRPTPSPIPFVMR